MLVREAFVLVGPTASGKSGVGQLLAERLDAAILSADSMLVYQGMDIGTAKPSVASRGSVPYLGIDLVAPDRGFDLWQYLRLVRTQLERLPAGMPVLVVGGSGLYVKALLEGLDSQRAVPATRAQWEAVWAEEGVAGLQAVLQEKDASGLKALADPNNPRRLIRAIEQACAEGSGKGVRSWRKGGNLVPIAGLLPDRAVLRQRIVDRVAQMYRAGLLEETEALLRQYPRLSDTACQAIGYREAMEVLSGASSAEAAQARTIVRTNRLAKRQGTWFRHQANVDWLWPGATYGIEDLAAKVEGVWRKHGSIQLKLQ